jgi:hypothetical protein
VIEAYSPWADNASGASARVRSPLVTCRGKASVDWALIGANSRGPMLGASCFARPQAANIADAPVRNAGSREGHEPPHIHVETAQNAANVWLSPVSLVWTVGYNARELRPLRELVEHNATLFPEKWCEYFGSH